MRKQKNPFNPGALWCALLALLWMEQESERGGASSSFPFFGFPNLPYKRQSSNNDDGVQFIVHFPFRSLVEAETVR